MSFGDAETEALLDLLALSLGYRPTGRLPHITRAVEEYARESDTSVSVLIARRHPALISRAIAAATVGHTLFFRHREHFERAAAKNSAGDAGMPQSISGRPDVPPAKSR